MFAHVWVEKDTQFCQPLVGFKYFVIQLHKLQPVLLQAPCSTHTAKRTSRTFPAKHLDFQERTEHPRVNSQPIAPMDLCNHPKQKCQCSRPFYYCTIFYAMKQVRNTSQDVCCRRLVQAMFPIVFNSLRSRHSIGCYPQHARYLG